jgi:hypothetical protein
MNYIEAPGDYPGMYIIYFGAPDVFSDNHPHKDGSCLSSSYKLGIFSNETIISYKKLQQLSYDLNANYKGEKTNLGISRDFSIDSFDLDTGNKISEISFDKNIPRSINIESIELPVVLINESGYSKNIIFNLKVW